MKMLFNRYANCHSLHRNLKIIMNLENKINDLRNASRDGTNVQSLLASTSKITT